MKMPFGKYKDFEVEEINTQYLNWLTEQNVQGEIRSAIDEELKHRREIERGIQGTTVKLPKHLFMEELAKLIVKVPDEFLQQDYIIKTPVGKFRMRIRKEPDV